MKVIVSVEGGVADVAYGPDEVEVVIVDLAKLRDEANTDPRIRAVGVLGEKIEALRRMGRVTDADLEEVEDLVAFIRGEHLIPPELDKQELLESLTEKLVDSTRRLQPRNISVSEEEGGAWYDLTVSVSVDHETAKEMFGRHKG